MRFLIDANCVIYLFANSFPKLTERVQGVERGGIGLSMIVFAELAHESHNGKSLAMQALERLTHQMPLLAFDEAAARAYAGMPFKRGRFDRLLAGHALALGLPIITRNVRDFADIPHLKTEDWTQ